MGRPKGKSLTREDVLRAAQICVERDGAGALTLSNVARLLGIKPPSICYHVATTDELRFALVERQWLALAHALLLESPTMVPGRSWLLAQATTLRNFALGSPNSFELMVHTRIPHSRIESGPLNARLLGPLLASLSALGVAPDELVHAARALRSAVTGFLLLEITGQFQMDGPADESFHHMLEALLGGLGA